MIYRSDILKCLSIIPITLILKGGLLISGYQKTETVRELFLFNVYFENPSRAETNIVLALSGLFEVALFVLLFGNYIYRNLCENSVYIFVRQKSRTAWFLQHVGRLFFYCAVYNLLYMGIIFVLCAACSGYETDSVAIRTFFMSYFLMTFLTYWLTIITNFAAAYLGESVAFIISYAGWIFLLLAAIIHEHIPWIGQNAGLLRLNPVYNAMINWHGGGIYPVLYYLLLIILTLFVGCMTVKKIDIGLTNMEKLN